MRFGCCAGPEKADVLLKAGCDFYEPTVINHLVPEKSEEEFMFLKEQFIKSKLKPEAFNCFLPGDLKVVGDTVDEKRFAEYISRAFMRAGEAGAKIIVFGSGGSRMVPDNYLTEKAVSQMKRALEIIVPAAKQNKLAVCIEGLNKKATNFLNRIDDIVRVVREFDVPEIRILANLFHMTIDEEPFFNLVSAAKYLGHIHVPVPDLEWIDKYEVPFEHKRFFNALKQAGYDGTVSLEDNGGRIKNWDHDVPYIMKVLKEMVVK